MYYGKWKITMQVLLAVALLPLNWGTAGLPSADAAGSGGTYRTKEEVLGKWNEYRPAALEADPYLAEPSIQAPYAAGQLQPATLQDGLNMVNFMRYLAGLPDDVEFDADLNSKAQHGAVLLSASVFSHEPPKPADMDETFYRTGYAGTSQGNLAAGIFPVPSPLFSSVLAWMNDSDESNISALGHRRWILNPAMRKAGFGYAPASGGGGFATMFAMDDSRQDSVDYDYVAYPSAGYFPSEFMYDQAWSVTLNPNRFLSPQWKDVEVRLTRQSDAKVWTFTYGEVNTDDKQFYVDHIGYGVENSIIFYTKDLAKAAWEADDSYHVHISGISDLNGNAATVDYDVNTFQMTQRFTGINIHATNPGEPVQFRGVTFDEKTNAPIGGVEVIITDRSDRPLGSVVSDANGRFAVSGIPDGQFRAYFNADDYVTDIQSVDFTIDQRFNFLGIKPAERKYPLNYADLIGKVVDANGAPVPGVAINIWDSHAVTDANGVYKVTGLTKGSKYKIYVNPGEASNYESQQQTFDFNDRTGPTITLTEKKQSAIPAKPADPLLTNSQIIALKEYWNGLRNDSAFVGSTNASLKAPALLSVTPFYKTVNNRSVPDYAFKFSAATNDPKRELTYSFTLAWAKTPKMSEYGTTKKVTVHTGDDPIEMRNDVPPRVFGEGVTEIVDLYDHSGYLSDIEGLGYIQVRVSDQRNGQYAASVKYWFDFSDPEHPKPIPPNKEMYKNSLPYEYAQTAFDDIYVFIDGIQQTYEQKPMIVKGTTMVPLRGIFEALGAAVKWNAKTRTVTATKGADKVELTIGKSQAVLNGRTVQLEQKAQVMRGATMVPLRFVGEAFQAKVEWDNAYRSIRISTQESN